MSKISYAMLAGPAETFLRSDNKDLYHIAVSIQIPKIVRKLNEEFDGKNDVVIPLQEEFVKEVKDFIIEVFSLKQWHVSFENDGELGQCLIIRPAIKMLHDIIKKIDLA